MDRIPSQSIAIAALAAVLCLAVLSLLYGISNQGAEILLAVLPFIVLTLAFGLTWLKLEKEVSQHQRTEHQLRGVLDQIQSFRGTVPICSACKHIREDSGDWVAVEHFISKRSDADFTHGICPPCADALYPE